MASGFQRLVINTRERALSTDINNVETFIEADVAETLRALLNSSWVRDSLGVTEAESSTLGTPVLAQVLQGLLVEPQAGSNDIQVRAGLACFIAPDAAPNESNYKFIRDAGVRSNGILSVPANPGVSAVVSVIECRINATPATTNQSRDVFNPATGLFVSQSVLKTSRGQLEYQVRSGGVGGGYPGAALGWLPLCIAVAPAGSVNNDGVEFWDVRPMLQDRLSGLMNVNDAEAQVILDGAVANIQSTATPSGFPELTGVIRANYRGWVAGGTAKTTVAGADVDYIRVDAAGPNTDALNPPVAFGVQGNVFACFPFGLPRWCRYNRTPLARTPGPFNGIPVVSLRPASPIGEIQGGFTVRLPASLGFGAAVDISEGVALLTVPCSSATATLADCSMRGHNVVWADSTWKQTGVPHTATSDTYTMTEDADFPRNITKFAFQDRAMFLFIPLYLGNPAPVLAQRTAFFSPSGFGIEDSQTETLWVPAMTVGQTNPQSESRLYWQSIPRPIPDAGPQVYTFVRSWTSLSPISVFTLAASGGELFIRGWYMR